MGHSIQTPCQKSGRHDHTDIRMLCMIPAAKFPDHHKRHDDQKALRKHTNNTADDQKDHQRYSRDLSEICSGQLNFTTFSSAIRQALHETTQNRHFWSFWGVFGDFDHVF